MNEMENIYDDLNKLNKTGVKKFYLAGHSLSCTFCAIIADSIKCEKVILTVPGDNLAESFWNGKSTQHLKREMQQNGMTLGELKKIWQEISPDNYFQNKGRQAKYFIRLTKRDKTIPYRNSKKLTELLKQKNIKFELKESKFISHSFNCLLDIIFSKRIFKFLN